MVCECAQGVWEGCIRRVGVSGRDATGYAGLDSYESLQESARLSIDNTHKPCRVCPASSF